MKLFNFKKKDNKEITDEITTVSSDADTLDAEIENPIDSEAFEAAARDAEDALSNPSARDQVDEYEFSALTNTNYGVNRFLNSLDRFSADDIVVAKDTSSRDAANRRRKQIRMISLSFCCIVFAICSVMLAFNLISKYEGRKFHEQFKNDFSGSFGSIFGDNEITVDDNVGGGASFLRPDTGDSYLSTDGTLNNTPSGNTPSTSPSVNTELERMRAKLESYIAINPDVYGYIQVTGTPIAYVIVQGENNDYYLDHRWDGKFLVCGSIFADYRNNPTVTKNYNTILYGHNMTDGTMFHGLEYFNDYELFKTSKAYIYTLDGAYVFEPVAFYRTKSDYDYIRTHFVTTEDFTNWATEMISNSIHHKDYEFTPHDRILTLSTCVNGISGWRYTLQCTLTKSITN